MKNYLIITLGMREIQIPISKVQEHNFELFEKKGEQFSRYFINKKGDPSLQLEVKKPSKEFPNYYTISPRTIGKIIKDKYEIFRPIIDFPIVRPAIEFLQQKGVNLDVIMLVYTDQEEEYNQGRVKYANMENDSIYYADIIEKLIKENSYFQHTEIDHFVVTKNVTDLGFQYDDFVKINEFLLYSDEVKQVFVYPQGGIDQINQALTLRLIEVFKEKVKQLQKAEGAEFSQLDFPAKFLGSLNKQKIIKHLEDYDFGAIDKSLSSSNQIYHLAQYANKRLNLQYDLLEVNIRALGNHELKLNIHDDFAKLKDIYLAAKINYHQKKYTEFLWRLYTLNESLFKIEIRKLIGNEVDKFTRKEGSITSWEKALNKIDSSLIDKIKSNKMPDGRPVDSKNPNRLAFKILFNELAKLDKIRISEDSLQLRNKVGEKLEALSSARNGIAHKLGSTNLGQINSLLNTTEKGYKSINLIADLDLILKIHDFDIYDTIKKQIEDLL